MENSNQNLLLAVLCDREGIITDIVRNDFDVHDIHIGRLWSSTVHPASTVKALNFLRQIQDRKVASDWSINIDLDGQVQALHFTGWLVGAQIYIVGSQISMGVDDAYLAGLMSINNEQANFIRSFIKEFQSAISSSDKREFRDLDEFSRLNNELVTLQRELVRKNAELEENRQLIKNILETTPEIIFIYDLLQRKSIFVNQLVEQVLGYSPKEGQDTYPSILNTVVHEADKEGLFEFLNRMYLAPDGKVEEVEFRVQDAQKNWRWISCRCVVFARDPVGKPLSIIGTAQDQTERKLVQEKLLHMSTHDMLTGIYNRFYFEVELRRLKKSRDYPISIVIADLDGLKTVNDTYGHSAGDALIIHGSQILKESFRMGDIVARLGGDEFGVLLPRTSSDTVEQIMSRVKQKIDQHNQVQDNLPVNFSFGWATVSSGESLDEGVRRADRAMYQDKQNRKRSNALIR